MYINSRSQTEAEQKYLSLRSSSWEQFALVRTRILNIF